jgi:ribulose-5-phosphate 4-epimerase/fuculose-1-phosphate aldolase
MGAFDSYKLQIVETAQNLTAKGYLMATGGNVSVRILNQHALAITPSNYDYLKMVPDDICILDDKLRSLEGDRKPSVESAMHAAVYQTRADVNAVVHTHQVYASALTLIKASIPALFDEQVRFLGRSVDLIPYAPSGTGLLKGTIARHIGNHHNAYLMQNHGVLCFGHDLERAAHNVEILEKCALAYLLAICTDRAVSKIPLAVREIAFARLRADQKKAEQGLVPTGSN